MRSAEMVVKIPKELNPHSSWRVFVGISLTWLMFYGSMGALVFLWQSPLSSLWILAGTIAFCVLGGYGMLDMGFAGHDAFHFSLHAEKQKSCWIGILATTPIFLCITG